MDEYKNVSCHLIGLNPYTKQKLLDNIDSKKVNIIDLDVLNQNILQNEHLDKLYLQFQKLKIDKNDKYKEVDKKMSLFWEKNFINDIENKISEKKINILIGQNNHYKSLNKRVNIDCTNKFIVKSNICDEVKSWIKYNLDNYKEEIINGNFPLDYINYDFLTKKRISIENTYKKIGYIEKTFDEINTIINFMSNPKNTEKIWISMKEPYNIGSYVHPKLNNENKINGYADPNTALLSSLKFSGKQITKPFEQIIQNLQNIKKLQTRRFLYSVDIKTFIPNQNSDKNIFFSQVPVKVLTKEKIANVYNFLLENKSI